MTWLPFAGDIFERIENGMDALFTSDEERLKAENEAKRIENHLKITALHTAASTIRAEVQSESWMTRNWRGFLFMTFGVIICFNYAFRPILNAFLTHDIPEMIIPPDMWDLIKIGLGGYTLALGGARVIRSSQWGKK
jgi:hypothetical protein